MSESSCSNEQGPWLEFPHYTRPPEFRGLAVPDVLLAGDHGEVARWRHAQAWRRTWALRPDLRPVRSRPAGAPLYLAVCFSPGHKDMSEQSAVLAAVGPPAARAGAQLVVVGPRAAASAAGAASYRGLKELARELRRRHDRAPRLVGLGDLGDLPVARAAAPLLDLLATTGAGDLSAPLVLVLPCAGAGDLARTPGATALDRPPHPSHPLKGLEAAFSPALPDPDTLPAGLAETPSMHDSSGPQPAHRASGLTLLAATALADLKPCPLHEVFGAPP